MQIGSAIWLRSPKAFSVKLTADYGYVVCQRVFFLMDRQAMAKAINSSALCELLVGIQNVHARRCERVLHFFSQLFAALTDLGKSVFAHGAEDFAGLNF